MSTKPLNSKEKDRHGHPGEDVAEDAAQGVLRRLVGGPARLFRRGRAKGLFPADTPQTRQLVEWMIARGAIEIESADVNPLIRITSIGRAWLAASEEPGLMLRDLLEVARRECATLSEIETALRDLRGRIEERHDLMGAVLEKLTTASSPPRLQMTLLEVLADHERSGVATPCTMHDLYARLRAAAPQVSIGLFHDLVRLLRDVGHIRLTAWTGPLYQLPHPELALLIGHEVLYYVERIRSQQAA